MANYTIIGGDGKQYGPITGDELRKWISEGRLNAHSLAKADSDAEFRPLATFPELADAFGTQAAMPDAPPSLGKGSTKPVLVDEAPMPGRLSPGVGSNDTQPTSGK